jgi:excisionase family DNA binding protein
MKTNPVPSALQAPSPASAGEARDPERMLTRGDVAWRLNVSKSTVHRLMKEGLPFRRLHGSVRFVWSEVREWMERNDEGRTFNR